MKHYLHTIFLFVLFVMNIFAMQAQPYNKLWDNVEQASKQGLPQTALKYANTIYEKANQEKNFPQKFRAFQAIKSYRQTLYPDSFYTDLKRLESWADSEQNPQHRAILQTRIAVVYANLILKKDTGLATIQSVFYHAREALKDKSILLRTSAKDYEGVVFIQPESSYFNHDLYHVICNQLLNVIVSERLTNSPTCHAQQRAFCDSITNEMYIAYREAKMSNAQLLVRLSALKANYFLYNKEDEKTILKGQSLSDSLRLFRSTYWQLLEELKHQFPSCEALAEVYIEEAKLAEGRLLYVLSLNLCNEGLRRFPHYERIQILEGLKHDILLPHLEMAVSGDCFLGKKVNITVSHCNLTGFTLAFMNDKKEVCSQHFCLIPPKDYQVCDTVFSVFLPPLGVYKVGLIPDSITKEYSIRYSDEKIYVTRMKILSQELTGNKIRFMVVDNQTGIPIPGAMVRMLEYADGDRNKNVLDSAVTNERGEVVMKKLEDCEALKVTKYKDEAFVDFNSLNKGVMNTEENSKIRIFTNRSVYRPGQTVYVKGLTYRTDGSEIGVEANRQIKLGITNLTNYKQIISQQLMTDEFGSFSTSFTLPASGEDANYEVEATDQNINIERINFKVVTHETPVGKAALNTFTGKDDFQLIAPFPNTAYDKKKIKGSFAVRSLSGAAIQLQGNYQLLDSTKTIVRSGTFCSDAELNLSDWSNLADGLYDFVYYAKDAHGQVAEGKQHFVLFSASATRPPVMAREWGVIHKMEFNKKQAASFDYGTSFKNVHLWIDTFSGDKLMDSKMVVISDTILHFVIPYKEEYGRGLQITTRFVKEGRLYQQNFLIKHSSSEENLKINLFPFSRKVQPGENVQCTLMVTRPDGKAADADVMVAIDDASEGELAETEAWKPVELEKLMPLLNYDKLSSKTDLHYDLLMKEQNLNIRNFSLDFFMAQYGDAWMGSDGNVSGYFGSFGGYWMYFGREHFRNTRINYPDNSEIYCAYDEQKTSAYERPLELHSPSATSSVLSKGVQTRTICYPQLHTDKKGKVSFTLTVPDNPVRWSIRVHAHTKDMKEGSFQKNCNY